MVYTVTHPLISLHVTFDLASYSGHTKIKVAWGYEATFDLVIISICNLQKVRLAQ